MGDQRKVRGPGRTCGLVDVRAYLHLFVASAAAVLGAHQVETALPSGLPAGAVFELVTMTRESGRYHSVELGTAFFIRPNGTALTNSHVVYKAHHDPERYQLLALVGHEFYSADVVCASPLAEKPAPGRPVELERDVAEIRVVPSRFPFTVLGVAGSGVVYYAHLARPPIFPVIELGKDPAPGDTVRIVGFGRAPLGSTENPAEPWTAIGTVSEIGYAMDGTPVFRVASTDRPRPGSSGAPVLDSHGRLVGMWTWNQQASWAFGVAIASSALLSPCNHQSREEPAVRPLDQHEPLRGNSPWAPAYPPVAYASSAYGAGPANLTAPVGGSAQRVARG
jgi:hypothetical protein